MGASLCEKCGLSTVGHVMVGSSAGAYHFDCTDAMRDELAHRAGRIADLERRADFDLTVIRTQHAMLLRLASKQRRIAAIIQEPK